MSIRVSIIIPIFNAASTLQAAVDSLLRQDLAEVEFLLVDDGSTDETPELCHRLASRDSRIQVVTQKNAGICAARNRGLSVARGEYIAFCDDDDEFLPGALRLLYETAEREQADIVRGNYQLFREQPDGSFQEHHHAEGRYCRMWEDGYAAFLQNDTRCVCRRTFLYAKKIWYSFSVSDYCVCLALGCIFQASSCGLPPGLLRPFLDFVFAKQCAAMQSNKRKAQGCWHGLYACGFCY